MEAGASEDRVPKPELGNQRKSFALTEPTEDAELEKGKDECPSMEKKLVIK